MKVIFQDIDYVLNSHRFEIERDLNSNEPFVPLYSEIDPQCMVRLKKILESNNNIKIVISSDRRSNFSLAEFKKLFEHFNISASKIIGTTSSDIKKQNSIELWIKKNNPSNFLILDDDNLFDLSHPLHKHFYKVKSSSLDDNDVMKIKEIIAQW